MWLAHSTTTSIPNLFKKIKGGICLPSHLSPRADLISRMLFIAAYCVYHPGGDSPMHGLSFTYRVIWSCPADADFADV